VCAEAGVARGGWHHSLLEVFEVVYIENTRTMLELVIINVLQNTTVEVLRTVGKPALRNQKPEIRVQTQFLNIEKAEI